nr:biopolymer transporter ExbD [Spiribacter vilamensis]
MARSPAPRLANRPRGRRNLISLTPLIDVVFILLMFFMLASSFLDWRAIELDPPQRAGSGDALTGAMLVEVRAGGLRLAGKAIELPSLVERLRQQTDTDPDLRVLIRPAEGVSLQRTVDVLDRLDTADIDNVSLIGDGR